MKQCRAPANIIAAYKKYKETVESHVTMEVDKGSNTNPTVEDFREQTDLDAPGF